MSFIKWLHRNTNRKYSITLKELKGVTPNWRDEMVCTSIYKRKFALLPIICIDETEVWFKHYYSKYNTWSESPGLVYSCDDIQGHREFVENITEAEYIVRKLAENL